MFSNTGYEAMYRYLGLMAHSKLIELISTEAFFKGLILIIFGVLFLTTAWGFMSRYMFGNIVERRNVPLSRFFKIALCLIVGLSILRVESRSEITNGKRQSWHTNQYVRQAANNPESSYKVSFVYDILTRTVDELARYMSYAGDYVFGNSQTKYVGAPFAYAKAMMLAGSSTIEDDSLKKLIDFYTDRCISKILPRISEKNNKLALDKMFQPSIWIDTEFRNIPLVWNESSTNCFHIKNKVRAQIRAYGRARSAYLPQRIRHNRQLRITHENTEVSSFLVNHFKEKREGLWGIRKGSNVPGTTGKAFQYFNRFFSWDTWVSILTLGHKSDLHGASEAATRAQAFSELLSRAPHLKGMAMMILSIIFPFLVFWVVAGKWKVIVTWLVVYASIAMWTPIWTIMFHIVNNLAMSGEALETLGRASDGVSLYAAELATSRIYYLYSVYSLFQTMVPIFTTGLAIYFARPMLSETQSERAPEFIKQGASAGSTVAGIASGLPH